MPRYVLNKVAELKLGSHGKRGRYTFVALGTHGCPEFSKKLLKMVDSNLQMERWAKKLRDKIDKIRNSLYWAECIRE